MSEPIDLVATLTRAMNGQAAYNEAVLTLVKEMAEQISELRARVAALEETLTALEKGLKRLAEVRH